MIKDTSKQMAKVAVEALKEKKGYDVKVIDISEISILADYFIIANGSNAALALKYCAVIEHTRPIIARPKSIRHIFTI